MKFEGTKMPWKLGVPSGRVLDKAGFVVADTRQLHLDEEEIQANGRLIFCAPEMYQEIFDYVQACDMGHAPNQEYFHKRFKELIQKATTP